MMYYGKTLPRAIYPPGRTTTMSFLIYISFLMSLVVIQNK